MSSTIQITGEMPRLFVPPAPKVGSRLAPALDGGRTAEGAGGGSVRAGLADGTEGGSRRIGVWTPACDAAGGGPAGGIAVGTGAADGGCGADEADGGGDHAGCAAGTAGGADGAAGA